MKPRLTLLFMFALAASGCMFQVKIEPTPTPAVSTIVPPVLATGAPSQAFTSAPVDSSTTPPAATPTPLTSPPAAPTTPVQTGRTATLPVVAEDSPGIHLLVVTPTDNVQPGDTIAATWQASGRAAVLCFEVLARGRECEAVPLSGSQAFTVTAPEGVLVISLEVTISDATPVPYGAGSGRTADQYRTVSEVVEVDLGCIEAWFFDGPAAPTGICPAPVIQASVLAQQFERGWLLWVEQDRRYVILTNDLAGGNQTGKYYDSLYEPVEPATDTAALFIPPSGLYAPQGRLGRIWRGDYNGGELGYYELLGWALAPESGYQAPYQCDVNARYVQVCYLTHPGGGLVVLHPGYWDWME